MTAADVLRAARTLIDTPEKWCQGEDYRNAEGEPCLSPYVASSCCSGAAVEWSAMEEGTEGDGTRMLRVRDGATYKRALELLRIAMGVDHDTDIPTWNDAPDRTHAEVMAAFDRAIEAETTRERGDQ